MHGGGSPDGAKLVIGSTSDIESLIALARKVANIKEEIPPPERK